MIKRYYVIKEDGLKVRATKQFLYSVENKNKCKLSFDFGFFVSVFTLQEVIK